MTRAALVGWTAIFATLTGSACAQDVDWLDHDVLAAGEVLVDFGTDERFRGHIRTAVLIDAAAENIWAVISDCPRAPEFVPTVQACDLQEAERDGAQIYRQRVKLAWFIPSFEHDFRLAYEPYSRIDVSHVSGPMKVLDGTWWLIPDDDAGIILIYSLMIEPEFPRPDFILGRMLQGGIPVALTGVRERAETAYAAGSAL
jgi:ribosome-associated toxin RatA of RatAB toxin-antitoxin module